MAISKWLADGTPPPMESPPDDAVSVAGGGPVTVVDASTRTGPASAPERTFVVTVPSDREIALKGFREASVGATASEKVTDWFERAVPSELSTLNFNTAVFPPVAMTPLAGDTETNCRLPAWAGFTMTIVWAGVSGVTVACMITPPVTTGSAVKVTEATPFTVLAAAAESFPAQGQIDVIAKFTTVPSVTGFDTAFRTVALMSVVWPLVRFELTTLREMDAGGLVIKKLPDTGVSEPTVARTVTEPEDVPA